MSQKVPTVPLNDADTVPETKITGAAVVDVVTTNSILKNKERSALRIADERQEEIVFDHALAKSSNVTSPAEGNTPLSNPASELYPVPIQKSLPIEDATRTQESTKQIDASNTQLQKPVPTQKQLSETAQDTVIIEGSTIPSRSTTTAPSQNEIPTQTSAKLEASADDKIVKPIPKPVPRNVEVINVEDDFFSMSYKPIFTEKKKKKKKKKKVVDNKTHPSDPSMIIDLSEEPSGSTPPMNGTSATTVQRPDDVIVIDDDSQTNIEPLPKKQRLTRPITPPPIDEVALRQKYRSLREKNDDDTEEILNIGNNDDFSMRLARLNKITESVILNSKKELKRSSTSDSTDSSEGTVRSYILHVTSFLPGSEDNVIDMEVKGSKRFSTVIKKTLDYLLKADIVPAEYHFLYTPSHIALFWKQLKLQDFMKVDTLNIPAPLSGKPTEVDVGMYTLQQAAHIEELKKLEGLKRQAKIAHDEEVDKLLEKNIESADVEDPFEDDEEFKEIDKELSARPPVRTGTETPKEPEDNEEEGYFKIGLKGEDNKKIIVKVNSESKIINLIKYYLKMKGLPENTKARMTFDDEDIDINGTVGDTELEDEFTAEIHIL